LAQTRGGNVVCEEAVGASGAYIMKTRNLFASAFALVFLFLLGTAIQPASAITLNNGDVVIYNFDFTGQTPPPPYQQVNVDTHFSGVNGPSVATEDFFDAFNANGPLIHSFPVGLLGGTVDFIFSDPGILDGIFSLRITANGNPFNIDGTEAFGFFFGSADSATVNGELVTPLPATLPLFAGGLGVIGLLARRRRRQLA
jgi:hypothetical protein